MLKSWFVSAFLVLFFASPGHAYFMAVPQGQGPVDYSKPTRILLSGRGGSLGMQAQMSARSKAVIYRRNFPEQQVVLLSVFENDNNEAGLVDTGWTFIERNDIKLETGSAVKAMLKFKRIKSLELFGHNSPSLGTQADGKGFRFDPNNRVVNQLAPNFDRDAFAIVHGCNSGWIVAQILARVWNIAVAGSFTGTRFERLHSDGHFYVDDKDKFPAGGWAIRNDDLGGARCSEGGCLRMRPSYSPYNGEWGDFEAPMLSHYKFFCQLEVPECEKRMALALYGYLAEKTLDRNSTREEFRDVAKQYLCPVYKDRKLTNDCDEQLDLIENDRGNRQISYVVNAKQLACNLRGCKAEMVCNNGEHRCEVKNIKSSKATTLTDEYRHLLKGYDLLKVEGGL